jgi:hypothetical protein
MLGSSTPFFESQLRQALEQAVEDWRRSPTRLSTPRAGLHADQRVGLDGPRRSPGPAIPSGRRPSRVDLSGGIMAYPSLSRERRPRAGGRLGGVLDHHDLHPFGAARQEPYARGRRFREVDNATLAAPVRSTVINFHDHLLLRPQIGDLHLGPQG